MGSESRAFAHCPYQTIPDQTIPPHRFPDVAACVMSTPLAAAEAQALVRLNNGLKRFYEANPQIKSSHGLVHVLAVHRHAEQALACLGPPLPDSQRAEIEIAALLHDVDDRKYFPVDREAEDLESRYTNACTICHDADLPGSICVRRILQMISWVSCSENGNSIPAEVSDSGAYHLLIPRWADRLEAVGAVGVVRCYRYNQESGAPLCSTTSPRATTTEDVFRLAKPERFDAYLHSGGSSDDMISHYYDKLLHIARPPPEIVRNSYLESMAEEGSKELVEVCVRFGKTGIVDEEYILELEKSLGSPGTSVLDDLPPGILPSILAKYCDAASLSALLVAGTSSASGRKPFLDTFASAIKMKVDSLEKADLIPATKGHGRWNRQTMNISDELRKFCEIDRELLPGDCAEDEDVAAWNNVLANIRNIARALPPLRLFGNEGKACWGELLHPEESSNLTEKVSPRRFEIPLWIGYIPISYPQDGAMKRIYFSIDIHMANSTWRPILLAEWAKLYKSSLPMLRPRPRNATPLPPLARIQALPSDSDLVRSEISALSAHLTASNEVIELDVPKGNRILIFSRLQAIERMKASSIWQYYLKQRREIVDEETWSIAHACFNDGNSSSLVQVIKDPYAEELEFMNRFDPEQDRELFAFVEPTDESNNEAGEDQAVEMSRNIQKLLDNY